MIASPRKPQEGHQKALRHRLALALVPPAPNPPHRALPTRSARSAYLDIATLFVIFFGPGTLNAGLLLAGQWRPPAAPPRPWQALSSAATDLAWTAAAVWLVALLAERRGLRHTHLGWRPPIPDRSYGVKQALAVGFGYLTAIAAAVLVSQPLQAALGGGEYPDPPPGWWNLPGAVTRSLQAGVVEELVLVAALVVLLEQAGQPRRRIVMLGLAARLSFHLYYGDPHTLLLSSTWVLLWAAAALGLYLRCRRVTPLIVAHTLFDLAVMANTDLPRSGALAILIALSAAFIGAGRTWLRLELRSQASPPDPVVAAV
jgi:hypothetical protein